MAGDNTVNVEFIADTSQMTSGIAKAEAAMAAWRAEAGLAAQPTIDLGRKMVDLGAHAYKTAADFKPATAEMRAASVAVEELGTKAASGAGGLGAFRGTMRALHFDLFQVVAALGLMVKAVDEAGKAEASSRHLGNMGEGGKTLALGNAAANENFQPAQYYDAARALKVAGVASNDLVGDITEIGKASRVSGVPFEKLTDTAASMADELQSGGIPSLAQMTTLTMASSGATQGLTDKYRELAKTLVLTEQQWKLQEEAQARSHKKTEEQTSAATGFADKIGLSGKVFEAFQARTSYMPGMGEGSMSGELTTQYSEGLNQLSKESGMATEMIRGYMASGKVGYEDLISASGRYRSHQQEELTFTQKQRDETMKLDTEAKQRALGLSALKSVMSPSDWKDQAADLQKLSPEGQEQKLQAVMISAMAELGKAIVTWFPEIKVAMMFLAGVEIASRLAALNARFFPNAFKTPGGAPGAAEGVAEGVAEGGKQVGSNMQLLGLGATLANQMAHNADPLVKANNESVNKAFGDKWNEWFGGGKTATPPTTAVVPNTKPAGANGLATVEDPKVAELVGRLLQVFLGGAA